MLFRFQQIQSWRQLSRPFNEHRLDRVYNWYDHVTKNDRDFENNRAKTCSREDVRAVVIVESVFENLLHDVEQR